MTRYAPERSTGRYGLGETPAMCACILLLKGRPFCEWSSAATGLHLSLLFPRKLPAANPPT